MTRTHARGEGTVVERNGQWYAVLSVPGVDGKRRRKWIKAWPNTDRGAEQTRRRALREVANQPPPSQRARLGDWLAAWLERRAPDVRPNTLARERGAIARLTPLSAIWLDALTPAQVQAWVDGEVSAGYAPRTVATRLDVLKAALTLAVDLELITRNPAARVRRPRIVHQERAILTAEQARALLAATEATVYAPLFGVAVACCLRQGEAIGLRWSDVNLDTGRVTLRQQAQPVIGGKRGAKNLDAPLKTPAARRTLLLPAPLVGLLRRHRDRQRLALGSVPDLVCTRRDGQALHPSTVRHVWYGYRKQIGADPSITFHDLRHSAASLLASQGVPPSVLKAVLGHTTLAMTDHYSHATDEGLAEAAAVMAKVLDG